MNDLAEAVDHARKVAREHFEDAERAKDDAAGLKEAESTLAEAKAYLTEAKAKLVLDLFIKKTEHWHAWKDHASAPLAYLDQHGVEVSDPLDERGGEGGAKHGFSLRYRDRVHKVRFSQRPRMYWGDDTGTRGVFSVLSETDEPLFEIGMFRPFTPDYAGWGVLLDTVEVCKNLDWLVDFAVIGELAEQQTSAFLNDYRRSDKVRRASQIELPSGRTIDEASDQNRGSGTQ